MAAQSTLFSMQAEGSLVDTPQGSSLECLSTTTRGAGGGGGGGGGGGRPRCPCVGRHRTSWLGGNSRGRWQWPVRPSLLNPILSDKVGRSPYSSALVTRSRQLALRTRRKNVGLNFGPISKPGKSF